MKRVAHFTLSFLLTVVFLSGGHALAQWRGYEWGHGPGMIGSFGPIVMVIFWIAVIVGVIFLIRWLVVATRCGGSSARPEDSGIEILKRRYARAEIDKEEFEEKKKDLI